MYSIQDTAVGLTDMKIGEVSEFFVNVIVKNKVQHKHRPTKQLAFLDFSVLQFAE